jgi:selenide,water dikinase
LGRFLTQPHSCSPSQGVGSDCSLQPSQVPDVYLASTTDFFYPLVEDPYTMGKIGAANVLSDLYAAGIFDCTNVLMILAASSDMPLEERRIVLERMIKGFSDQVEIAGSQVTGGQTIFNPWPMIGGTAMSVVSRDDLCPLYEAQVGDVLVLTKPLGTQVAVNLHQWLVSKPDLWKQVEGVIEEDQVLWAYDVAAESMQRLNRTAAILMKKYNAHAATDVTGFGILGHANNLARQQRREVSFVFDCLPCIKGMAKVDLHVRQGNRFQLCRGLSAETSGGLLIALPSNNVEAFLDEIYKEEGWKSFIVGRVIDGNRSASLKESVEIWDVE